MPAIISNAGCITNHGMNHARGAAGAPEKWIPLYRTLKSNTALRSTHAPSAGNRCGFRIRRGGSMTSPAEKKKNRDKIQKKNGVEHSLYFTV